MVCFGNYYAKGVDKLIDSIYSEHDSGPSSGIAKRVISAALFKSGGGQKSSSTQRTVNKDNSAIVEEEGVNVSDSSMAAQDQATAVSTKGDRSSVKFIEQAGEFNLAGGLKNLKNVNLTVQALDGETVAGAFEFGTDALDFVSAAAATVGETIQNAHRNNADVAERAITAMEASVSDQLEDSGEALARDIIKYGSLAVLGITGGVLYLSRKGGEK